MPDYRCEKFAPKPPVIGQVYNAFAAAFDGSRQVTVIGFIGRTPGCQGNGPATLWRVRDQRTGKTFLVEPWMIGALEPDAPAG